MENRFERLYGYVQRSLAKNIRNELGNNESLTVGILLFSSFSESFYYASTIKNTLLYPKEVIVPFKETAIWDYELMKYLGQYFALPRTKEYIRELLLENDKLVNNNASYFAIAFENYLNFKNDWLQWFEKEIYNHSDTSDSLSLQDFSTKLFYFSNYLLTIIRLPAYRTSYVPNENPYAERIYRTVINDIPDKQGQDEVINAETGEFKPSSGGNIWRIQRDSLIKYSELTLLLEICFKAPISTEQKTKLIKVIYDPTENPTEDFPITAMGRPLHYNGEFQGIVYVTRNINEGVFDNSDFEKFTLAVRNLHIESILYTSKYDTARFLLETLTPENLERQSILRILDSQHLFSSSPLGLIILSDSSCYTRLRIGVNNYMRTQELNNIRGEDVFNFFTENLKDFYSWFGSEKYNYNSKWLDIDNEREFNDSIKKFFNIDNDLFIRSLTCMKFIEKNGKDIFYFLFNSNHLVKSLKDNLKQNFALRTHNDISKLLETEISHRKVFTIHQKEVSFLKVEVQSYSKILQEELNDYKESDTLKALNIIGDSISIKWVKSQTEKYAKTDSKVLIRGDTGTGKKLIAKAIHELSKRKGKPFVSVNCASIPNELIESELFGHEKGSFTGAFQQRRGKFELANKGTLFLDEIGDMSPQAQAKVLDAIESGKIESVGGEREIEIDVRIVAATNKNLKEEIKKGNFREDLYHRLNVISIYVSPLKERILDIPKLVEYFLVYLNVPILTFTEESLNFLKGLPWNGNIRELKNFIERVAGYFGDKGDRRVDLDVVKYLIEDDNDKFSVGSRINETDCLEVVQFLNRLESILIEHFEKEKEVSEEIFVTKFTSTIKGRSQITRQHFITKELKPRKICIKKLLKENLSSWPNARKKFSFIKRLIKE